MDLILLQKIVTYLIFKVKDAPPIVNSTNNSTSAPLINPSQTANVSAAVLQHVASGESRTTLKKLESELCKVSGVNPPNNIPTVANPVSIPAPDLPVVSGGKKNILYFNWNQTELLNYFGSLIWKVNKTIECTLTVISEILRCTVVSLVLNVRW